MDTVASRYELERLIGEGGMGDVYRGTDRDTGEVVAIKVLKNSLQTDPAQLERFIREGEALRQLNHPNIVKMLTTISEDGKHYIVMEYVGGGSLRDLIHREKQLSLKHALQISLEIADALSRTHHLKIVHRDIKPANILLAEDGTPRLTDFGLAHLDTAPAVTNTGSTIGTYAYLSPEAAQGEKLDARTDIWSFGVVLYEMLAGRRPFQAEHTAPLLLDIMTKPVPDILEFRADLPLELVNLLTAMLQKDRERRIPSARQVGAELEAILHGYENQWTRSTQPHEMTVVVTPSTPVQPRHNLPMQPTAFVGREEELAEIRDLLTEDACRLVTIVAQGGMGKTRLSIEAARAQLTRFENGVFFVPLAPLTSPDAIPAAIAEAVGFSFFGTDEPKVQLTNFLREKHMLLVMDNFEHVISGAALVSDILQMAPKVKVLATSRERLRLQGEWTLHLEGLKFPDYLTPEELTEYSALQLFVQNARRVQPDFAITSDNKKCMVQISQLVEGMPLALELAATWLEALPLDEIVTEIQKSIDFLETDLRDVPERHRSIRAVFDYSWRLMTEDEQEVFKRLSVFRGGFTREAAQEIAGASLRTLTTLVNKSLLRRHETGRYEIHELLRQYAAEKCLMTYSDVRDAHSRYYLKFLADVRPRLASAAYLAVMEEVDVEMDNLRAAWDWAVQKNMAPEVEGALLSLYEIYETRSMFTEGVKNFGQAIEAFRSTPVERALVMFKTWFEMRLSDFYTAAQVARDSALYFQKTNNPQMAAFACGMACYALMNMGEYDEAKTCGQQAIEIQEGIENERGLATSYANLGYVYYLTAEYEDARRLMEKSQRVSEKLGSHFGMGFSYNNLGEIMQAMGQYEEACVLYEKAYDSFKKIRNRRGMAFTMNNIGGVYYFLGDLDKALEHYQKAFDLNKEIGDRTGIGHSLSALGNWHFQLGEFEKARAYYEQSLEIRREICDQRAIADSLTDLGETLFVMGQFDEAKAYHQEGLDIRREIGDQRGVAFSLAYVGRDLFQAGDYDQAEQYFLESRQVAQQVGSPGAVGQSLMYLSALKITVEKFAEARHYYEEIAPFVAQASNVPWWNALHKSLLGLIEIGEGRLEEAQATLLEVLHLSTQTKRLPASPLALWGIAQLQAGKDQEMAVMLLGYLLNRSGMETSTLVRPRMLALLETLRSSLPHENFERAYDRGKAMTSKTVLQEILENYDIR